MAAETQTHAMWTEDLVWQARRGFEIGSALCTCGGSYHTLWGSLRLSRITNTMIGEAGILASLVAPYVRDDARVMIGGSADPGVLCGIGRIYAPRMPILTVIDKCRAPLALIREFAAAKGLACRTLKRDLLDLTASEMWDLIVLHYTPDFVDPHLRGPLFRSVAGALAPGGILVCATMTGASLPFDKRPEMEAAYLAWAIAALNDTPMADVARTPGFEQQLRGYAACRTLRRLSC